MRRWGRCARDCSCDGGLDLRDYRLVKSLEPVIDDGASKALMLCAKQLLPALVVEACQSFVVHSRDLLFDKRYGGVEVFAIFIPVDL